MAEWRARLSEWVGVLFSAYLTWAEVARIHAICRYCVVSAGLVVVLFSLSLLDLLDLRDLRDYRRAPK